MRILKGDIVIELSLSNIIIGFFVFIFGVLLISSGIWVRSNIFRHESEWKVIFIRVLIGGIILCIILAVFKIIDNNLTKYEVGVNINIYNKSNSFVEINIDGTYYDINKNETININNLNSFSGFIAIKTSNNTRIWFYNNKKSVFQSNKKVKIVIDNKNIKINSFLLDITTFIKNYEGYDASLDFLIKKRQNGI
jgi:hypothetical protein